MAKKNKEDNDRQDKLSLSGEIVEVLPAGSFRVAVGAHMVLANLSGKMRENKIRVTLADKVEIEVSPYDLSRGRIVRRT
jgi:translation initiation factor IF-1